MPHPPLYKEGWGYSKRGVKGNSMANRGNSFNIPGYPRCNGNPKGTSSHCLFGLHQLASDIKQRKIDILDFLFEQQ